MKIRKEERTPTFARGPEVIPRIGTRTYEEYQGGRRFFAPVVPGQRFPKEATWKQLVEIAGVEDNRHKPDPTKIAVASVVSLELAEPSPEPQTPAAEETAVA
jgi:hypothetical protein